MQSLINIDGKGLKDVLIDLNDKLVQRIINNCYIKPMPLPLH